MSEQPEELDFEERRKRLEQLFSAEPNLSPTMRARQLDDEPQEQSNGHHAVTNTPPASLNGNGATAEAGIQPIVSGGTAPLSSGDTESSRPDGMVNILAARLELRQRSGPADIADIESGDREPDGLDTFRNDVLARWRRDIYADR